MANCKPFNLGSSASGQGLARVAWNPLSWQVDWEGRHLGAIAHCTEPITSSWPITLITCASCAQTWPDQQHVLALRSPYDKAHHVKARWIHEECVNMLHYSAL